MLSLIKNPPRIPELLFAALLIWLFATGDGWSVLLADGDTGWHIRNGEQIIDTRTVPTSDAFAFGTTGHPWYSWEWLSDVLFAALFRQGGLRAVTVFCGIMISASVTVLFHHMVWRSIRVTIALPLALLTAGASSVHYLARPHALGLLFFAAAAWIIDRDRACRRRLTWALPVLLLLWANCHGSFLAGLAIAGLWCAEALALGHARRPAAIFVSSAAATLCNPYGWHLHAHALEYLRSGWIQSVVDEFQSPRFRSETMFQFEILLMAGLVAVPWLIGKREYYAAGLIVFWAHESLASVRHVPLYCLAACPFTGSWLQSIWNGRRRRWRPGSWLHAIDSINVIWQPWSSGFTIWPVMLCVVIATSLGQQISSRRPVGFPANKFPVNLVEKNLSRFAAGSGPPPRIFSSDQWSDYLIFRFYPAVRVFFDGRSDFFGPWRGDAYQKLMGGQADSPAILERENVRYALLPADWPLAVILRESPHWRVVDADGQAVLFVRDAREIAFSTLIKNRVPTDR